MDMEGGCTNWSNNELANHQQPNSSQSTRLASSSLICYPWLADLESTLNSVQGTKALESYLVRCGSLPLLEFIWACDGMKSLVDENPEKADQLVSCIYKNYIISGVLPLLSNQVVITIARRLEAYFERPEPGDYYNSQNNAEMEALTRKLDLKVFDDARTEVESYLRDTIFPEFRQAVNIGNVYVGGRNGGKGGGSGVSSGSSQLASQQEAFAMALCEKLEGLKLKRRETGEEGRPM